ncbi:MAG: hypothetical protein PHV13_05250 [Candidatus ainarchaeum sp.]|nr:hypothetical protein [Candidatus ainarchaeum sp.]
MKATLSHIGAVSLGRLLAIWSFVIGVISLVVYTLIMGLLALLGVVSGSTDLVQTILGLGISLVMGVIALVVGAIAMFIVGFLSAVVYNIILGVGGGIDIDLKERA